jgi:HEAT repeats
MGNGPVVLWFALLILGSGLLVLALRFTGKKVIALATQPGNAKARVSTFSSAKQAEAEQLLQRAAANDAAAPLQILAQSENWIGKTQRTPRANGLIAGVLNSHDIHTREAGLQAELAMDGVPWNERSFDTLQRAVNVPHQRAWALWTLGALGNRGVEPVRTAKVIQSYVLDPDANVRASAVIGLSILGSDATIPVLLDRFRNDASPAVQEEAACALAEAGMYTHEQRMVTAASLVNWLDDSRLTASQRMWVLHALRDISGQNPGEEPAAWRRWYESSR